MSLKKTVENLAKEILHIKAENFRIVFKSKSLRKSWRKIQIMSVIMKVLNWMDYNPALQFGIKKVCQRSSLVFQH